LQYIYHGLKLKRRLAEDQPKNPWETWCELTYVVAQAYEQGGHGQDPEDGAERLRHAQLEGAGLALEVEGQGDCHGDDGHVDGQAEVRQES
jgi:hypothetical protein